jgi:hypothetical protein
MQPFKIGLRIWIATSSLLGFLGGWALLAHSPKPAQPSQPPALQVQPVELPPLPPMPSFNTSNANIQPLQAIPQSSFSLPRMRTGGS